MERVEYGFKEYKNEDCVWGHMQELVTDVVIPFQEDVLNDRQPGVEKSHAIEKFKILQQAFHRASFTVWSFRTVTWQNGLREWHIL